MSKRFTHWPEISCRVKEEREARKDWLHCEYIGCSGLWVEVVPL